MAKERKPKTIYDNRSMSKSGFFYVSAFQPSAGRHSEQQADHRGDRRQNADLNLARANAGSVNVQKVLGRTGQHTKPSDIPQEIGVILPLIIW